MRSSPEQAPRAFVTFRVAGDSLDPAAVTDILDVKPTEAHRKGEKYGGQRSGRPVTARTGIWYFSTDRLSNSGSLGDHFELVRPFLEAGCRGLHRFIQDRHLTATMTFFWHGHRGATAPTVPDDVKTLLRAIPATVETDFGTDQAA
jgi:Domain of unknown function (DUF4279)